MKTCAGRKTQRRAIWVRKDEVHQMNWTDRGIKSWGLKSGRRSALIEQKLRSQNEGKGTGDISKKKYEPGSEEELDQQGRVRIQIGNESGRMIPRIAQNGEKGGDGVGGGGVWGGGGSKTCLKRGKNSTFINSSNTKGTKIFSQEKRQKSTPHATSSCSIGHE